MKIYGLYCPVCKREVKANPEYEINEFYICEDCGKVIGYRCSGCEEFFEHNNLVLHDDLYVCKVCGTPQYGYSSWKINQSK